MCDASCGIGRQTRVRLTLPPSLQKTSSSCSEVGPFIQAQACVVTPACATSGCTFGTWTNWGPCSATCGGGVQIQTRTVSGTSCGPVLRSQLCNTQVCV